MAELHRVSGLCESATADVIFVHGLDGHWQRTWQANAAREAKAGATADTFWPQWVATEFPRFSVWSLQYEASMTNWQTGMSLGEHGEQALACLSSNRIGDRPVAFVAHSLGGLVVKSLLRSSYESAEPKIARATRGVVLFGTPNSGSRLVNSTMALLSIFGPFGQLLRPSQLLYALRANEPELLMLNRWYRDRVTDRSSRGLKIYTEVFYETRSLGFGLIPIVDRASADPGIASVGPIPIAENHISMCKLARRDHWVYRRVVDFLAMSTRGDRIVHPPVENSNVQMIEMVFTADAAPTIRLEINSNLISDKNLTLRVSRSNGNGTEE